MMEQVLFAVQKNIENSTMETGGRIPLNICDLYSNIRPVCLFLLFPHSFFRLKIVIKIVIFLFAFHSVNDILSFVELFSDSYLKYNLKKNGVQIF